MIGIPVAAHPLLADCAFVVDRARRIKGAYPTRHGLFIGAIPCFVAHAPSNDARVIFVALNHARDARNKRGGPLGLSPQLGVVVVRFKVSLVDHIKPILIAQLIEAGRVGVVAGPNGVDVVLLHSVKIESKERLTNNFALGG